MISAIETARLLTGLAASYRMAGGLATVIQFAHCVHAVERVQGGEVFDLAVLSADAITKLDKAGRLRAGSIRPLADITLSIAVQAGAETPSVRTEAALKAVVLKASSIGCSAGATGSALIEIFERWGLAGILRDRLVQTRHGVSVGSLLTSGKVDLGFLEFNELPEITGITILGRMPAAFKLVTRFCGAVTIDAVQPSDGQALLDYMASPLANDFKQNLGMRAVTSRT